MSGFFRSGLSFLCAAFAAEFLAGASLSYILSGPIPVARGTGLRGQCAPRAAAELALHNLISLQKLRRRGNAISCASPPPPIHRALNTLPTKPASPRDEFGVGVVFS